MKEIKFLVTTADKTVGVWGMTKEQATFLQTLQGLGLLRKDVNFILQNK